jgi:hypothetical protein
MIHQSEIELKCGCDTPALIFLVMDRNASNVFGDIAQVYVERRRRYIRIKDATPHRGARLLPDGPGGRVSVRDEL